MRRKSIRRDRYIGGTASARVRGPSFFGVVVFILGETGNTWIMHGKLWHGCRAAVPVVAGKEAAWGKRRSVRCAAGGSWT